jgi:hypothetical protein
MFMGGKRSACPIDGRSAITTSRARRPQIAACVASQPYPVSAVATSFDAVYGRVRARPISSGTTSGRAPRNLTARPAFRTLDDGRTRQLHYSSDSQAPDLPAIGLLRQMPLHIFLKKTGKDDETEGGEEGTGRCETESSSTVHAGAGRYNSRSEVIPNSSNYTLCAGPGKRSLMGSARQR